LLHDAKDENGANSHATWDTSVIIPKRSIKMPEKPLIHTNYMYSSYDTRGIPSKEF
jgi:hypothetical protein